MNTKEQILNTSLDLFSTRGYSSSSVRDVCKIVGIKESSMYYHFKNKQAILEELKVRFTELAQGIMCYLEDSFVKLNHLTRREFMSVCNYFLEHYLLDQFTNKFIRIMIIEQADNCELRTLYHKWVFTAPIEFQSKLFDLLMQIKYLKKDDSRYMAVSYFAPIFYYFNLYLIYGTIDESKKRQFMVSVDTHLLHFLNEYEHN